MIGNVVIIHEGRYWALLGKQR